MIPSFVSGTWVEDAPYCHSSGELSVLIIYRRLYELDDSAMKAKDCVFMAFVMYTLFILQILRQDTQDTLYS